MRHYVVRITLLLSGYEKGTVVLVEAISPEQAKPAALLAESHNIDTLEWTGTEMVEDDGMVYSIYSCDEVSKQSAVLFGLYLPTAQYNREELARAGNFLSQESA